MSNYSFPLNSRVFVSNNGFSIFFSICEGRGQSNKLRNKAIGSKTGFFYFYFWRKRVLLAYAKLIVTLLRCYGWFPGHYCVVIRFSEWSLGACLLV